MKTLNIIRGLPGSGKSTLARLLTPEYIAEADQFFINSDGTYQFDKQHIGLAHGICQRKILRWMELQVPAMSVANTFTTLKEMEYYQTKAAEYGYTTVIYHCESNFSSIHNVPPETIARMKARWEPSHD